MLAILLGERPPPLCRSDAASLRNFCTVASSCFAALQALSDSGIERYETLVPRFVVARSNCIHRTLKMAKSNPGFAKLPMFPFCSCQDNRVSSNPYDVQMTNSFVEARWTRSAEGSRCHSFLPNAGGRRIRRFLLHLHLPLQDQPFVLLSVSHAEAVQAELCHS